MAQGARVTSIAALREFRPAIIKFVEEARAALVAAEGETNRTLEWLRNDRVRYWKREVRVRQDDIVRCKTELMNKQRSATGDPRSAVEERKALDRAKMRLDEATTRQAETKRWLRRLEKEHMQYKGGAQALSGELTRLEDHALFDLDRMAAALEDYVSIAPPTMEPAGDTPPPAGSQAARGFGAAAGGTRGRAAPPSPFARYRAATPSAGRRRRAEAAQVDARAYEIGRVDAKRQDDELQSLFMDDPPDDGATVAVSRGALDHARIYMERAGPTDPADSGWYLAAAPDAGPEHDRRELLRVPLAEVLRLRPGLGAALRLAEGCLVVADGSRVLAVTAPNDTIVLDLRDGAAP